MTMVTMDLLSSLPFLLIIIDAQSVIVVVAVAQQL